MTDPTNPPTQTSSTPMLVIASVLVAAFAALILVPVLRDLQERNQADRAKEEYLAWALPAPLTTAQECQDARTEVWNAVAVDQIIGYGDPDGGLTWLPIEVAITAQRAGFTGEILMEIRSHTRAYSSWPPSEKRLEDNLRRSREYRAMAEARVPRPLIAEARADDVARMFTAAELEEQARWQKHVWNMIDLPADHPCHGVE